MRTGVKEALTSFAVTRTEYKRSRAKTGWGNAVKEQLMGSDSRK